MKLLPRATLSSFMVALATGIALVGAGGIAAASLARSTSGSAFLLTLGKPSVVGSLPPRTGGALPVANPAGCLIVLNSDGDAAETWSNQNISGPWDMTTVATREGADLFVANALSRPKGLKTTPPSGLCTVVRIKVSLTAGQMPRLTSSTVVGSGFVWRANKAAFIQAPTGVALSSNGTRYVAETVTNRVSKIPDAMTRAAAVPDGGSTLSAGGWLNGPLGVTLAPNGDVIAMNGNDGNAVEISPQGHQVAKVTLVTNGAGDLFGATVASGGRELVFVNDGTNALDIASTR